jgi:AraC family transcriptional regulator, positive regulator of tynA and feaB
MDTITTDTVPARDRLEFWADLISRHVNPMRFKVAGDHGFRGCVRTRMIAGLAISAVSGEGIQALHGRSEIARTNKHFHIACVHLGGDAQITHRDEAVGLLHGDVFLTDSRRHFTLGLERPWQHLVVALPTHWLDGRLTRPELASDAVLRGQPLARLWARLLVDGYAVADTLSQSAAAVFAQHSIDLLAQALEEGQSPRPTPSEAARAGVFLRACRLITLAFGDPALTPDHIAKGLGVSTRTLERIFAGQGESVMRRIYDERIRQAARLLTDARAAHRSVTDIAFACGFNDASHFGRVFAARMQMTPSQWRRQN